MYSYCDEDNSPMMESVFDHLQTAQDVKESMIVEGFLDDLGIGMGTLCRKCKWMMRILSEFIPDEDMRMPGFCYDMAHEICKVCKANPGRKDRAIKEYLEREGF